MQPTMMPLDPVRDPRDVESEIRDLSAVLLDAQRILNWLEGKDSMWPMLVERLRTTRSQEASKLERMAANDVVQIARQQGFLQAMDATIHLADVIAKDADDKSHQIESLRLNHLGG